MSQLANALNAARRGLRVFPCLPETKRPAFKGWAKDATTDEDQIRRWWAINPDFNPGVTGGTVVDGDTGLNSLDEAIDWAESVGLAETLVIRTGGRPGFRVQFHYSSQTGENAKHYVASGVSGEIRSGNSLGLAPGAIHPDSKQVYEIAVDLPVSPAPLPEVLREAMHAGRSLGASAPFASDDLVETTAYRARETFERLLRDAKQADGGRNRSAHRVSWYAARALLTGIFEITFDENRPALSEREVRDLIRAAVFPHYRAGERDLDKMLKDSWNYGFKKGPLKLDIYWSDLDQIFSVVPFADEKIHRLLDGVTTDFSSAEEARDFLIALLNEAGLDEEARNRVLHFTKIEDAVTDEIKHALEIAELLGEV